MTEPIEEREAKDAAETDEARRARGCRFCFKLGLIGFAVVLLSVPGNVLVAMLAPPTGPEDVCLFSLGIYHLDVKASCSAAGTFDFIDGASGLGAFATAIGWLFWRSDACAEAWHAQLRREMARRAPIRAAAQAEARERMERAKAQQAARRAAREARNAAAAAKETEARAARKAARNAADNGAG